MSFQCAQKHGAPVSRVAVSSLEWRAPRGRTQRRSKIGATMDWRTLSEHLRRLKAFNIIQNLRLPFDIDSHSEDCIVNAGSLIITTIEITPCHGNQTSSNQITGFWLYCREVQHLVGMGNSLLVSLAPNSTPYLPWTRNRKYLGDTFDNAYLRQPSLQ